MNAPPPLLSVPLCLSCSTSNSRVRVMGLAQAEQEQGSSTYILRPYEACHLEGWGVSHVTQSALDLKCVTSPSCTRSRKVERQESQ
ncbi:hypothetical protein CBOM_07807 [Ceraceosorus bombacis]|uniref:Uncharacterized protein n=1 Tax=Ceraceosorus bombacis TaxID=401625 RepID=A0A0P1BA68_9BASI|nr:hypothetical protein CBOM_07807 [Ceraceosorus bombacis]